MTPRIGALCAGYGGLDMAVQDVLGGELAWVAEKDPAASKVLAHRFPGVPNLGDITEIDWDDVESVDIVTAGWPCQDMSLAGLMAGLTAGTRSGLWFHIVKALAVLRPPLVVLENVRGLLSARADSDVEPCPGCLGDDPDEPVLRALGCVLGDLADLGFDAEWVGLRAADVGACHPRFRVGVLAWPAAYTPGQRRGEGRAEPRHTLAGDRAQADGGRGATESGGRRSPAADTDSVGPLRDGATRRRRSGSADDGQSAGSAGDTSGVSEPDGPLSGAEHGVEQLALAGAVHRDRERDPAEGVHELGRATPELAWGPYAAAIARWELILGRPAPTPTEPNTTGGQRLSARLVEWMQGCPDGWVTDVPGLSRNDQLRILGNGVVRQQFAVAIRVLLHRAFGWEAAA